MLKYISGQCIGGCDVYGPPLSLSGEDYDVQKPARRQVAHKAAFESLDELPFDQVFQAHVRVRGMGGLSAPRRRLFSSGSTRLESHFWSTRPTKRGRSPHARPARHRRCAPCALPMLLAPNVEGNTVTLPNQGLLHESAAAPNRAQRSSADNPQRPC